MHILLGLSQTALLAKNNALGQRPSKRPQVCFVGSLCWRTVGSAGAKTSSYKSPLLSCGPTCSRWMQVVLRLRARSTSAPRRAAGSACWIRTRLLSLPPPCLPSLSLPPPRLRLPLRLSLPPLMPLPPKPPCQPPFPCPFSRRRRCPSRRSHPHRRFRRYLCHLLLRPPPCAPHPLKLALTLHGLVPLPQMRLRCASWAARPRSTSPHPHPHLHLRPS